MIDATRIIAMALHYGFQLCGIAQVTEMNAQPLQIWLDAGYGAEMDYLRRHLPIRANLTELLPEAKSLICVAAYYQPNVADEKVTIADYARGEDYHDVINFRLQLMWQQIVQEYPRAQGRVFVDNAPLPERELARRAGIGWVGKNSCLINPHYGSRILLGEIITTLPLVASAEISGASPVASFAHCNDCERCLTACPTGALCGPGQLDSRRCLSYLTIEARGAIPRELRPLLGNRLFGCDTCQQVCPFNQFANHVTSMITPLESLSNIDLAAILRLTAEEFRSRFKGTAIFRAKRRGLLRNACVVCGNIADASLLVPLRAALQDEEALVRGHAAWALGRMGDNESLVTSLLIEEDDSVREEILFALENL